MKQMFEPFAQERTDARSNYQGTGLGMTIVKGLVEQMNGTIEVSSEEGVGSTFVLTIPFRIASPEENVDDEETSRYSVDGLSLLLAEDNALNAEIAEVLLTDSGVKVTIVEK
ncbi:MAG: ATP-binding protein [Clostridium sp.]|uniref:ATP-binding protein n=1 Tax=Butyribacter sp. TaxID=2822465 RepID=UPI002A9A3CBB|nr:ATP-binding protein [Clostridium sp.]MDY5180708.1 ATP-binding protein [Butyribacter sp.]